MTLGNARLSWNADFQAFRLFDHFWIIEARARARVPLVAGVSERGMFI
jgi:hypothetical protein